MTAGGKLDFGSVGWADDQPDIRSRAAAALGSRWAVVEYGPHAARDEWCVDGAVLADEFSVVGVSSTEWLTVGWKPTPPEL